MPSSFTPTINLEKPATGEQDLTWGNTCDANFDKIDAAIATVQAGATDTNAKIAWLRVGSTDTNATGASSVIYSLPSGYTRFRVPFSGLSAGTGASLLYAQFSVNNGASWDSASHYTSKIVGGSSLNTGYVPLGMSGNQTNEGYFEFSPASGRGFWINAVNTTADLFTVVGSILYTGGVPTNILFATNAAFTGGTTRLEAWKAA